MEIGHVKWGDMPLEYRDKLMKAYMQHVINRTMYMIQENFIVDEVVGQSQSFERAMDKLYPEFYDIDTGIKMYLYRRLPTSIRSMYRTIKQIEGDFDEVNTGAINPFALGFKVKQ